ncbi:hypothetical protein ONS95_007411 [Cadophora gregata]|uniref:uncharacterized protein n=1 Tax=Cadophora gregata TaxID=51156 RepID=UPI0026DCB561|nr:uncharacterized protein ONS95_007411 [Cadophora gregata]KAK0118520.1 hypothetical protein ONS96_011617 [Cadophora gregata f. sp. sojae]KAK0125778.1 hypothetical protein ONS95_007411 [Cadophora gregata]
MLQGDRPKKEAVSKELYLGPKGAGSFGGLSLQEGVFISYALRDGWGALLIPMQQVVHHSIPEPDDLLMWVNVNAQSILNQHPEVKKHGFYLVSGTYTTNDFYILVRDGPAEAKSFVLRRTSQGNFGPRWVIPHYPRDNITSELHFEEQAVISFEGFHFTYKKLSVQRERHSTTIVQGEDSENEKALYEFEYTPFIWPANDRSMESW